MKKMINRADDYVDEMLEGLTAAYPSLIRKGNRGRVVCNGDLEGQPRVGLVSGGGSGHLPLFTGYVGRGLLDACAIGNVFEGPTSEACLEAIYAANQGRGVLLLYGNYGGDRMNFDMAAEAASLEGVETRTVLGTDDIASAPADRIPDRRGVAGIIFAYKTAGAKAGQGASLDEVSATAVKAISRTRTIGLAVSACQIPGSRAPTFNLNDDQVEMGMGIHGEAGIWRDKIKPADELADEMLDFLLQEVPTDSDGRISILINSLGATPLEELFILYRRADQRLKEKGFDIVRPLIGHFATSMEMAGVSVSISHLDDELLDLLESPARCPFWAVP